MMPFLPLEALRRETLLCPGGRKRRKSASKR
jgi:hypothetical protein